jgi:hypothetical protein
MDKVIISSFTPEDFERLSYMASYLLQLNFVKKHSSSVPYSCSKYKDYYVSTDDCILTVEEIKLLIRLKNLRII